MPELILRPYRRDDIPAITAIYAYYVRETVVTFDVEPPPEAAMADKFDHLAHEGHPLIIAERNGELLGYAYASIYRPRPAYRFTCEDSIYLHPDARGQGLGGIVMTRLIEDSRRFGFRQMIAVITAEAANSIVIHKKFGFREVGRYEAVGFKFDRWLDIVHMQKAL